MDRAVAALSKELLDLAAPQPGERVLDIGCGPGTTVLELARRIGAGGHVLGADVSEPSVARARERIAAAGLRHAEVIVADASVHPFPPDSFELTFSRFGIMFFSDPVAAFANMRRAMKPGGRLTLAVFRPASEKLWPNAPLEAVRDLLPPIPTPGPEEPGPFSWADPARVHRILEGAGFSEVSLTPLDPVIQLAGPQGKQRRPTSLWRWAHWCGCFRALQQRSARMCVGSWRSTSKGTPHRNASFCRPRSGWSKRVFDAAALYGVTSRITGSVYCGFKRGG
jgi:SAM-dependent methyltransferase